MTTASDHHGDVVGHADGGDHRVEREDDVEQQDLDDDAGERRRDPRAAVALLAFELVVNLVRALGDQEQAADDQDQVAAGDLAARRRRTAASVSRITQVIDQQQRDADDHRQRQAELARALARSSARSLPARIEMKTMLSMPRTISRTVSVREGDPALGAGRPSKRTVSQPTSARLRAASARLSGTSARRAPGLGVLPDQRGEIQRDVLGRIRRRRCVRGRLADARRPAAPSAPRRRSGRPRARCPARRGSCAIIGR